MKRDDLFMVAACIASAVLLVLAAVRAVMHHSDLHDLAVQTTELRALAEEARAEVDELVGEALQCPVLSYDDVDLHCPVLVYEAVDPHDVDFEDRPFWDCPWTTENAELIDLDGDGYLDIVVTQWRNPGPGDVDEHWEPM